MVKKRSVVEGAIVQSQSAGGGEVVKKRKAADALDDDSVAEANKRVRNRASPIAITKLYTFFTDKHKDAVIDMELGSLLDIKCSKLHYGVIKWFAERYDKDSREFVIPGRGRIPLNTQSVYHTLGLPRGPEPFVYAVNAEIEALLAPALFPGDGSAPSTTRVFEILKGLTEGDLAFKQIWLMYVVSTVLAPRTKNHVSNRCYPMMADVGNLTKYNLCQFVADRLHYELSVGKYSQECLFHLQVGPQLARWPFCL